MKKIRVHGPNLQSIKTFSLLNKVSIAGVVAVFSKRACCCQQRLPQTRKYAVFVLARPTSISSARALPQKLSHWFCSQNIQCPVEKPAGVIATPICHMTWVTMINRGSGLDSNLNSASWLMSCKESSALKSLNKSCGVWILFRSVEDAKIETCKITISILIPQA